MIVLLDSSGLVPLFLAARYRPAGVSQAPGG